MGTWISCLQFGNLPADLATTNTPSAVAKFSIATYQVITLSFSLLVPNPLLDFWLSRNNDVKWTLAHDSGYYCTLRVKKLGKIPRGLRPLGIFPRFFTLRVQ